MSVQIISILFHVSTASDDLEVMQQRDGERWWPQPLSLTWLSPTHARDYFLPNLSAVICWQLPPCWHQGVWAIWALGMTTGAALATNPWPLQTHLSCPACIASGNFILEFPSINSPILSVEQTTSLARACVNVRIGEFMLGNSRTKLPAQCMLGRRVEFEGVAICNAERCQPCI